MFNFNENVPSTNSISYAAILLRVSLGTLLIAHGLLKVLVFTMPGAIGFFDAIGIPAPTISAYLVVIFELFGGALLLLGILTRWVAAASVPLMLGAAAFAHAGNGWLFSNEGGGWEYPVFLAIACAVQWLLGSGNYKAVGKINDTQADQS